MRACAECARQGGETPSLQGPGIGGAQSRASAQERSEKCSKQLQLQLLVAKPNKSGIETVDVRRALNDFVHLSDFILDSSENPSQLYY